MPTTAISHLEKNKFPGPEWVHDLQVTYKDTWRDVRNYTDRKCKGSNQRTNKAAPHSLDSEYVAHLLKGWIFRKIINVSSLTLTSIENKTPPIGEPKATATPAALAAVTTSLILPNSV